MKRKGLFLVVLVMSFSLILGCGTLAKLKQPKGPEFAEEVGKRLFTREDKETGEYIPVSRKWGYKVLAYGKGIWRKLVKTSANGKKEFKDIEIDWGAYSIETEAGQTQVDIFMNQKISRGKIREFMKKKKPGDTFYHGGYPSIPKSTLFVFRGISELPGPIGELADKGIKLTVSEYF